MSPTRLHHHWIKSGKQHEGIEESFGPGCKAIPARCSSTLPALPLSRAGRCSLQLLPSLSPFGVTQPHCSPPLLPLYHSSSVLPLFSFPSSRIHFLSGESHSEHARNPSGAAHCLPPPGQAPSQCAYSFSYPSTSPSGEARSYSG